eukprot:CAMPEP_0184987230 /NCGR_PEP_ID=MMETSP1098-20130426/19655_1 /TAXON_ID=89044 /ORGANISM="Spumella elongata, Strain CCAP 955/1" /LENGTH=42 /DNA_ID= /DNA_START= /DNA_END= /DNA_ORIENTATION=
MMRTRSSQRYWQANNNSVFPYSSWESMSSTDSADNVDRTILS